MSSLIPFFEQVTKSASILLDDVIVLAKPALSRIGDAATVAKMAAASAADDTLPLTKLAMKKASAVVVDDTAVSSDQLNEASIAQHREYAVWRKIVVGSLVNKVVIQAVIIITGAVAPLIPHLMLACGAAYLAYEGAHKMMEYGVHLTNLARSWRGLPPVASHHEEEAKAVALVVAKREIRLPAFIDRFLGQDQKERTVLTDLILLDAILSTEILLVANGTLGDVGAWIQIAALAIVGLGTTLGVYGIVLAIVRADNVAGYFADPASRLYLPRFSTAMMTALPYILKVIGVIGTTAMLGVAGDVVAHQAPAALDGLGVTQAGQAVHSLMEGLPHALGFLPFGAQMLASMLTGFVAGLILIGVVKGALGCVALQKKHKKAP